MLELDAPIFANLLLSACRSRSPLDDIYPSIRFQVREFVASFLQLSMHSIRTRFPHRYPDRRNVNDDDDDDDA